MSTAVVLDDVGVVDRDIGSPLVEVVDRVAAFPHHPRHKALSASDGIRRGVDEVGLHLLPCRGVLVACLRRQLDDVELLAILLARDEFGLRRALLSHLADRAFVFGPEVLP